MKKPTRKPKPPKPPKYAVQKLVYGMGFEPPVWQLDSIHDRKTEATRAVLASSDTAVAVNIATGKIIIRKNT